MIDLGEALLTRTAALVDIASVSRAESAIADVVADELLRLPGLSVSRIGDNVIASTPARGSTRILLGGHLDTVPAAGNAHARLEGDRLFGLGAADMKGGLAVMLELARSAERRSCATTYIFYAREEVARIESGLLEIAATMPMAVACDVAVLLEPTGAVVEAGCQGSLRVELTMSGVRAHSARPWTGRNAIHRLGAVIARISDFGDVRPVVDGCEYRESMQVVGASGGGAGNVVPDEARLVVNYRFAPDKSPEEAVRRLHERIADLFDEDAGDLLVVADSAPSAPPGLGDPVLGRLVERTGVVARAKLAWTDVAFFAERGIPAANFGPGDPLVAHRADEYVDQDELVKAYQVLDGLLAEVG